MDQEFPFWLLLYAQLPISFFCALRGHPTASFLLPSVHNHTLHTTEVTCDLTLPCLALAVLVLWAGLKSRRMRDEGASGCYDTVDDGNPSDDILFWGAATSFVCVRNLLLIEEVDLFALLLLSVTWFAAEFSACRPITHSAWLGIRLAAIVGFICTTLLLFGMVWISSETQAEAYVLALSVVADSILIVGHTWDYPECSMSTVLNCRYAYALLLQVSLPCAIAANTGFL